MKIKFIKSMEVFNSEMEVIKQEWYVSGSDKIGPTSRQYRDWQLPKYVWKFLSSREPELFSTEEFKDGTQRVTFIYRK